MNRRKTNNSLWYSLGLAVLLCIAFLVTSTGTALARYRAERDETITIEVREPDQICLGVVKTVTSEGSMEGTESQETTEVFDPTAKPEWETTSDGAQLQFAVANGISETEFSQKDQRVRLRMIGTLGLWTGTETAAVYLLLPTEGETNTVNKVKATVTPIAEGTALYHAHGGGWIFTFQDENEEELFWTLPGGGLSFISLTVTMEGAVSDLSLLQTQIIAESISE